MKRVTKKGVVFGNAFIEMLALKNDSVGESICSPLTAVPGLAGVKIGSGRRKTGIQATQPVGEPGHTQTGSRK